MCMCVSRAVREVYMQAAALVSVQYSALVMHVQCSVMIYLSRACTRACLLMDSASGVSRKLHVITIMVCASHTDTTRHLSAKLWDDCFNCCHHRSHMSSRLYVFLFFSYILMQHPQVLHCIKNMCCWVKKWTELTLCPLVCIAQYQMDILNILCPIKMFFFVPFSPA